MQQPHQSSNDVEPRYTAEIVNEFGHSETPSAVGSIRVGSPFRGTGTKGLAPTKVVPAFDPTHDGAKSFDSGITASTAMGGLLAAFSILPFAAISAATFPFGAVCISGLGAVLAIFALAAQRPVLTTIALAMHLCLGAAGYIQML